MKRSLKSLAMVAMVAAGVGLALPGAVRANVEVYQQVLPGTAWVMSPRGFDQTSYGSGVLVDHAKRWLVTNYHVVEEQSNVTVFFPVRVNGRVESRRTYYLENRATVGIPGRVIARDARRDLAVIELDRLPAAARAVTLAADSPSPAERVHSIGNPGKEDVLWVYTSGSVRQVFEHTWKAGGAGRVFDFAARVVLTQSPINPGDSGGPVVNDKGELVAVVSCSAPGQQNSECIDIREIRSVLDQARKGGAAAPPVAVAIRVDEAMRQAGLKFETLPGGLYRVPFNLPNGATQDVLVDGKTERFAGMEVRRVWAVTLTLNSPPSAHLATELLRRNGTRILGGWEVQQTQGQYRVTFSTWVVARASGPDLRSAIEATCKEASLIRRQFGSDQSGLTGTWTGIHSDLRGDIRCTLRMRANGTGEMTFAGAQVVTVDVRLENGALAALRDGRWQRLGTVMRNGNGRFTLDDGVSRIAFAREG